MVGGVFCLTSMAVAGKEISLQIDTFEILFYRSVIGVSIILFFLIKKTVSSSSAARLAGLAGMLFGARLRALLGQDDPSL